MSRRQTALPLASSLLAFVVAAAAGAAGPPLLVSPGSESEVEDVASSCPTFSWAPSAEGHQVQLAVFPLEEATGELGEAVLLETLPGSAASWTPPGIACLEPGRSYVWSVRAAPAGPPSEAASAADWASPRYFTVPARSGPEEIRAALGVLRSAGLLEGVAASGPVAPEIGEEPESPAPPSTSRKRAEGPAGIASAIATAERTGLRANLPAAADVGFGVHGVTLTTGTGSAGVVGEATAEAGQVHGVVGVTHSANGTAGLFENAAGGPILTGVGPSGKVFNVGPTGAVQAALFTGSGSGLTDVGWDSLADVPAAFGDGVDDDTTYQAGSGLRLSGTTLSLAGVPKEIYIPEQRVALAGSAGDVSIVIGRDGLPLIAFHDADGGELKVVHCKDTTCSQVSETTLDDIGDVGAHNAITLGGDGNALISYYDGSNGRLMLAHCHDVACTSADVTVVDDSGDAGQYSSITATVEGHAFIAYYHAAGILKAATCDDLTCSSRTIWAVDFGGVGEYASVARGFAGEIWISYHDAADETLKLVRCHPVACDLPTAFTVDGPSSGKNTAITIGADGHPLIAYTGSAGSLVPFRVAHCESEWECSSPSIEGANLGSDWAGVSITRGTDGMALLTAASSGSAYRCKDVVCSDIIVVGGTMPSGAVDSAVTIGSDGLPIIAYTSDTDGDVYIVHCSDVSCTPYRRDH